MMTRETLPDVINVMHFDKFELAKKGVPHPKNPNIVQISKCQYVILDAPGNAIINTSFANKSEEENKPALEFLSKLISRKLYEQELRKQGIDIDDLTEEDWDAI